MTMLGHLDGMILLAIQEFLRFSAMDSIMLAISKIGTKGIIFAVIAVIMLFSKKMRKTGWITIISVVIALVIAAVLKDCIGRVRPYETLQLLQCVGDPAGGGSFPSGHAAAAFAAASVIRIREKGKIWIPVMLLAIVISYSRLYMGMHYPTDVIGGAAMGIICGIVLCLIFRDKEKEAV